MSNETKLRLSVGAKAKVIKAGTHDFNVGQVVTIAYLFPDASPPHYRCEDGTDYWFLVDHELEEIK